MGFSDKKGASLSPSPVILCVGILANTYIHLLWRWWTSTCPQGLSSSERTENTWFSLWTVVTKPLATWKVLPRAAQGCSRTSRIPPSHSCRGDLTPKHLTYAIVMASVSPPATGGAEWPYSRASAIVTVLPPTTTGEGEGGRLTREATWDREVMGMWVMQSGFPLLVQMTIRWLGGCGEGSVRSNSLLHLAVFF